MPGEQRVLDLCDRASDEDMKWNDDRAGLELAIKLDAVVELAAEHQVADSAGEPPESAKSV